MVDCVWISLCFAVNSLNVRNQENQDKFLGGSGDIFGEKRRLLWPPIPYHNIPYHTIPYHTIPYHTTPYHTILYHRIIGGPTLHHTVPYHTIPYYNIPNHTIRKHRIIGLPPTTASALEPAHFPSCQSSTQSPSIYISHADIRCISDIRYLRYQLLRYQVISLYQPHRYQPPSWPDISHAAIRCISNIRYSDIR